MKTTDKAAKTLKDYFSGVFFTDVILHLRGICLLLMMLIWNTFSFCLFTLWVIRQKVISTNVLYIGNCSENSESITSHALGELTRNWRTRRTCSSKRRANVMIAILTVWGHMKNPTPSIDAYLFWRIILPNIIQIRFETTEPKAFLKREGQEKEDDDDDDW